MLLSVNMITHCLNVGLYVGLWGERKPRQVRATLAVRAKDISLSAVYVSIEDVGKPGRKIRNQQPRVGVITAL